MGNTAPTTHIEAAYYGDLSFFVANPLSKEVLKEIRHEGRSLLYIAARQGHVGVAQYLVSHGADVNCLEEKVGSTPLHGAAFYGHGKMVKLLLGCGASKDVVNAHGLLAEQEGKTDGIRQLISFV